MVAFILNAFSFASAPWLRIPLGKKSCFPKSDIISIRWGFPTPMIWLSPWAIGFIEDSPLKQVLRPHTKWIYSGFSDVLSPEMKKCQGKRTLKKERKNPHSTRGGFN